MRILECGVVSACLSGEEGGRGFWRLMGFHGEEGSLIRVLSDNYRFGGAHGRDTFFCRGLRGLRGFLHAALYRHAFQARREDAVFGD